MSVRTVIFMLFLILVSCKTSKINTRKTNQKTTETHPVKKKAPQKEVSAPTKQASTSTQHPAPNTQQTEVLVATSKVKATTEDIKKYIVNFTETTKANMKTHGIPASIAMAQGILESGSGFGTLAKDANNHFGIKCHAGWTGESVRHDDDTLQECFRKYKDAAESYKDHSLFLKKKRYEPLFKLDKGDYFAWANGLKQAGYATDPAYSDKLIAIIERFQLYELDNQVLNRTYKPKPKEIFTKPTESTTNTPIEIPKEHLIEKGDTLFNISKKYNISVDELIKLNNIINNQISIGQKLRVNSLE